MNQQTGRFDVNALKQFFDSYNKAKAAKSPAGRADADYL